MITKKIGFAPPRLTVGYDEKLILLREWFFSVDQFPTNCTNHDYNYYNHEA